MVSQDGSYNRINERNPYYKAALDAVKASISAGKAAKGALFWEWTVRNPSEGIDVSLPNGLHPYGVSLWDETFQCAVLLFDIKFIFPQRSGGLVRRLCRRSEELLGNIR